MFVVYVRVERNAVWVRDTLEYWTQLGPAITAARMRWRKDQHPRRVSSWPENVPQWDSDKEPRPDFTAMAREVFGQNPSQATEVTETSTYEGGPDGY